MAEIPPTQVRRHSRRAGHTAKRRRLTVLVIGSAVVLLTAALWVAHEDAEKNNTQAPSARDPRIIRIQRPERNDLVLQRESGTWGITAPCTLAVNQQRLSPLLEALNTPAASYPASDVDIESAGLTSPLATLILDDESIAVGGIDLSGERRYLQPGDRVELAPEWILSLVDGGLSAFASSDVFADVVTEVFIEQRRVVVDPWLDLSSGQTVEWPLSDTLPVNSTEFMAVVTLASGTTHKVQVTSNSEWQALVLDDGGCARLLPAATLPTDTARDN